MGLWWFLAGAAATAPLWVAWGVLSARRRRRGVSKSSSLGATWAEMAQLAGGLAHEIKNPLSTINMNLRLLAEDIERHPDDEHRRWLRRLVNVQEEADRLKATLNDFQRLAGKVEIAAERVDLRTVVEELVAFFAPQTETQHIVLRPDLPADPVVCSLDTRLIKQALLNLLLNAVQAMLNGGELIVRVSTQGDQALLEVIDTGPGLAPEDLAKVFDVYYSTKASGSGLGLPTTRRIVREHGGQISVESEPGKGTRFVLTFPLIP